MNARVEQYLQTFYNADAQYIHDAWLGFSSEERLFIHERLVEEACFRAPRKEPPTDVRPLLRDVFGPANEWDNVPEGTCVGTTVSIGRTATPQFVGFSVGWRPEEILLTPDEADALADLLKIAAAKCREAEAAIKEAPKQK